MDNSPVKKGRRKRKGESMSGYFRQIFEERPELINSGSNAELIDQWCRDHPRYSAVMLRKVKANLANLKSVLRKKMREGFAITPRQRGYVAAAELGSTGDAATGLERLEESIDDCLTLARNLDREGLADVISRLRLARNAVVWKMGES
jgi:hypothetical protein